MIEYPVIITETRRRTVWVPAASREQARILAEQHHKNGSPALGADDYAGATFEVDEDAAKAHRTGNHGKGNPGHER